MRLSLETTTGHSTGMSQQTLCPFRYDARMITPRPIVIVGAGYTGHWLYKLAGQLAVPAYASSRQPDQHLSAIAPSMRLRFDLADTATWSSLPPEADLIWTFPATPIEQVQAFARHCCDRSRRLVVLGSTSAYHQSGTLAKSLPPWIDETHPINTDLPRVQGEEYLRTHHGAIVLRVAGIYGPNRNPVEWIRQGRVGPTNKFVNLIHVEDLAHLCLVALKAGEAGGTYNVSDGQPRRWADICTEVSGRWGVISPREPNPSETGKRISNYKVITQLGYALRHPDLYEALRSLEVETNPQTR